MKYLPIPSEMYVVMSFFRCSVMAVHTISYRILVTLQDANQHLSVSVVRHKPIQWYQACISDLGVHQLSRGKRV